MQQRADSAADSAPPSDLVGPRGRALARALRRIEILAHLSGGFDIAEEQQIGHAARVAYLAHEVGRHLGFGPEERRGVLAVGLLHDAGVAVRHEGGHLLASAWVATRFGFDESMGASILATHERWDGRGRPDGLSGHEVPIDGLVVSAAHWASEFADSAMSPLRARAQLQNASLSDIEPLAGPEVAAALHAVLNDDQTWLAMRNGGLAGIIGSAGVGEGRPSYAQTEQAVRAMGEVIDAAVREPVRAARVAAHARQIACTIGLPDSYSEAVRIAGYLIDIGQLGVPHHITDKPSLLTVDEMELMWCHPVLGARLLEGVPGLGDVAEWVVAHHERPDGRGYPEMLTGEELTMPPRILAVADAYYALRAERPYREAFSTEDTMTMIELGADHQFDARVVEALPQALTILAGAQTGAEAAG